MVSKMNFGLPYKGSKNKIAKWVCDILPKANTLYDLFAGGGCNNSLCKP